MQEPFDLPVLYKGEEQFFKTQLHLLGYTHKFTVQENGAVIAFEPDEEGNYRAILNPSQVDEDMKVDVELLKAISGAIEAER